MERFYRRLSVRAGADRLRTSQLRNGSVYTNFRTLVPVVSIGLVWVIANRLAMRTGLHMFLGRTTTFRHLLLAVAVVVLWNLWLSLSVYTTISVRSDGLSEVRRLFLASFVSALPLLLGNLLPGSWQRGLSLAILAFASQLSVSLALLGYFALGAMLTPHLIRSRVALIVGSGKRADLLRARLTQHYASFNIFGCVDDEYQGSESDKDNYMGPVSGLAEILRLNPIEVVLIGLPIKSQYDAIRKTIEICELIGVESHYMQDIFETSRAAVELHSNDPKQFTVFSAIRSHPTYPLKRLFDILAASLLLCLASPILILAALVIRFTSPGPVLFVQQRYGLNRKKFPMFKFRSMVIDAEQRQAALEKSNEAQGPVFKIKADPRITAVGAFLRKTSIDELPQLFNVLRGEMSLVGPRPLPVRDVTRFEEDWLLRRFSVRPGLTCLWQINGRSNTSFDYWISQDLLYIDQWSFGLDIKILLRTIPAVLRGSGAS